MPSPPSSAVLGSGDCETKNPSGLGEQPGITATGEIPDAVHVSVQQTARILICKDDTGECSRFAGHIEQIP